MKIAWCQVRTVGGVWQYLPLHFLHCSCCHSGGVRTRIVEETDAFDCSTSSFWMKGWLYSVFNKFWSCVDDSLFFQKMDEWKLYNKELHILCSSSNIIRVIKWRRWDGRVNVVRGGIGCAYKMLVRRREGKRPRGKQRSRWEIILNGCYRNRVWGYGLASSKIQIVVFWVVTPWRCVLG
jgi:hypothetical protein